jgi:hypothetical protein
MRTNAHRLLVFVALAAVVSANQAEKSASQAPGIYVETTTTAEIALTRIPGRLMTSINPGSIKKAMLMGGFKSQPIIGSLPGPTAVTRVKAGSTAFHIQLDLDRQSSGPSFDIAGLTGGDSMPAKARNPEEFFLIRFHVSGNQREAQVGSTRSQGFESKDTVSLASKSMGSSAFIVTAKEPLAPGEYGFFYPTLGFGGQVWDFGVDPN